CGAALTFLACRKESRQRKRLTPPAHKWVPWLGGGSGASGIGVPAHSASVTRPSSFPPRTPCSPEGAGQTPTTRGWRGGGHRLRLGGGPKGNAGRVGRPHRRCARGGAVRLTKDWGYRPNEKEWRHRVGYLPGPDGLASEAETARATTMVWGNDRCGARSAARSMTALSLTRGARGHRFQMHHCPLQARGPTYE
ncbi:MAG: hypothetical protein CPSOU_6799, partial [uncultured Paraburkholderia sp.]